MALPIVSPPSSSSDAQVASGWKTVVVQEGQFRAAVIVKVLGVDKCILSPVSFHRYVRRNLFSRWLDESGARATRGGLKVTKLARLLGLKPLCTCVPSERMVSSGQPEGRGFEALASPEWLLTYVLLVNCCNLRKKPEQSAGLRKRAVELLDVLVRLSCRGAGTSVLTTKIGCLEISEEGSLKGNEDWEQMVATGLGATQGAGQSDTPAQVRWYTKLLKAEREDQIRVGLGCVSANTLSGLLWLAARVCSRGGGEVLQIAQGVARDLVLFIAMGLGQWFIKNQQTRTVDLIALQPARRRTMPELVTRMLQKKRPRSTAQQWRSDGMNVTSNVSHLEKRASKAYLSTLHRVLGPQAMVELSMDSTTFATKETNVIMAYSPGLNIGAYLPPMRCRKLRWRSASAGHRIDDVDLAQFMKTGYRTVPRMEIWDGVCELEHALKGGLGKSLKDFQFHERFPLMDPGHVRYYHPVKRQWYRACQVPVSGQDSEGAPELSTSTMQMSPSEIPVLLLCEDQKQSQWSGSHFLVDSDNGLGLFAWFRGDKYHRSWNDWKWATSKAPGQFNWTSVQLNYVFNVNYQPIGSGGHFSKRQETKLDWERLFPSPGPRFEALVKNIGLDSRKPPPTGLRGVEALYTESVLDDTVFTGKGKFMKQCAWYDIIRAISEYDPRWHARRFEIEEVARHLRGEGVESKAFVAQVAAAILQQEKELEAGKTESSKESYQARMKHLRKTAGNVLLLAPRLMHNRNLVNARVMLLVSKIVWTEQSYWGMLKVTPEQDAQVSILYASGIGDELARSVWKESVFDARELHRLGMPVIDGEPFVDVSQPTGLGGKDIELGLPLEEVPGRLMGFLLHFMEARLWSYAWCQFAYPEAFAALFNDQAADKAWSWAAQLWTASTDAEASAHAFPSAWTLRQQIYWLTWPLVQFVLRWMAHMHFQPSAGFLSEFLRLCLKRIGDTKAIEATHKIGRALETEGQSRRVLEPDVFYARVQRGDTPLEHRGIPHLGHTQDDAYCPISNSKLPDSGHKTWDVIHAKYGLMRMPSFLSQKKQDVLGGRYLTKTPASGRSSITAAQALVHLHTSGAFSQAQHVWQAVCFVPHTLVRNGAQVYMVLIADTYAARLWPAHKCPGSDESPTRWVFDPSDAWCWMTMTNAMDWHYHPTRWVVNTHEPGRFGYIAAEHTSLADPHVPIIAEALVQVGHRQLKHHRMDLCAIALEHNMEADPQKLPGAPLPASGGAKASAQEKEKNTMAKLLEGHPLLQHYMDRLQALHKKIQSRQKSKVGKQPGAHEDLESCGEQ